jgi:hypothetical protein
LLLFMLLTTLAAREMAPMAKFRKVSPDIPFFGGHFICKIHTS